MKIIILTGKFGMGHMKAAEAVKENLSNIDDASIQIIDWIDYMTPHYSKYIYSGYSSLVRCNSFFYNKKYKYSENRPTSQKPGQALMCYLRMSQLIQEEKPDLIISVLAYASKAFSYYKNLTGCSIPLITCITDITAHSEWINICTNAYTVGSPETKKSLIEKGVPEELIFVSGIPVRHKFSNRTAQRNTRPKVLVMGGGLGMLPKNMDFYKLLNEAVPATITLVTGKNQKLYDKLDHRFENIHVLGYVENIDQYFLDSDLIVTKPGGITTFEAIHSETPIIALNPTLHQEKYNAEFIVENGIGEQLTIHDNHQAAMAIARFINSPSQLEYCKAHMRFIKKGLESCSMQMVVNDVIRAYLLGGSAGHEIYSFNF